MYHISLSLYIFICTYYMHTSTVSVVDKLYLQYIYIICIYIYISTISSNQEGPEREQSARCFALKEVPIGYLGAVREPGRRWPARRLTEGCPKSPVKSSQRKTREIQFNRYYVCMYVCMYIHICNVHMYIYIYV